MTAPRDRDMTCKKNNAHVRFNFFSCCRLVTTNCRQMYETWLGWTYQSSSVCESKTQRQDIGCFYDAYKLDRTSYLVSDPPTQLSTPSRGAEPSSESAASLMLDLLHGTVFHTISIKSVTLVFSSAASKLNYFVALLDDP